MKAGFITLVAFLVAYVLFVVLGHYYPSGWMLTGSILCCAGALVGMILSMGE